VDPYGVIGVGARVDDADKARAVHMGWKEERIQDVHFFLDDISGDGRVFYIQAYQSWINGVTEDV
jgi:imidazoleglycerol phosphate synthase glutamine amidotransferase subunit HisH